MSKKVMLTLAIVLVVGLLVGVSVSWAAAATNSMPCFDPAQQQQMTDSHVKDGTVTQEQADAMNKQMNQMGGMMGNGMMNTPQR